MKFFDKIKDLFTDEIIEEESIKKEVVKVESKSVITNESPVTISDSEAVTKPQKSTTPIFFSDSDFEDLRYNKLKKAPPVRKNYQYHKKVKTTEEETIKTFKPSPIISPVYGILDKNYSKEDIPVKPKLTTEQLKISKTELTIDVVRKKAYGTLEDELESSMIEINPVLFDECEIEEEEDLFVELENKEKEDVHNNSEDIFNNLTIDEVVKLEKEKEEYHSEEMMRNDQTDKLSEGDLFDLIDSMYEKEKDSSE